MKKIVLIAIALVSLQAIAQDNRREFQKGDQKDRMHKQMDFTAEEIATLKTKRMVLNLDLTETQQREIHKINLANAKERKAKMEAHKKMRQNSKGEKRSKEDRFNMANERLDKQIAHKKQMKKILSKEQFEKFEKSAKHKQMRKHKQGKKQRSKRSL